MEETILKMRTQKGRQIKINVVADRAQDSSGSGQRVELWPCESGSELSTAIERRDGSNTRASRGQFRFADLFCYLIVWR
jgi:hypothetical protein